MKVTWLGEDTDDYAGPSFTTCFDRKFPKGKPIEVSDPDTIKRAQGNKFFEVEGDDVDETRRRPGRPRKDTDVQNAG